MLPIHQHVQKHIHMSTYIYIAQTICTIHNVYPYITHILCRTISYIMYTHTSHIYYVGPFAPYIMYTHTSHIYYAGPFAPYIMYTHTSHIYYAGPFAPYIMYTHTSHMYYAGPFAPYIMYTHTLHIWEREGEEEVGSGDPTSLPWPI